MCEGVAGSGGHPGGPGGHPLCGADGPGSTPQQHAPVPGAALHADGAHTGRGCLPGGSCD